MTSPLSKTWITLSIASALTGGLLFGITAASASTFYRQVAGFMHDWN